MFLRVGEASSQQPEMGDEEPCYFGCGRSFEVLGEAAASTEPGEGTFDDPAPRQELEALGALRSLDDFDGPRSAMGQCGDELIAAVNPVGKDMAKLGELEPQMFQQRYGSVDILDIGLVYAHGEQETIGVGDDVALAPMDAFASVESARTNASLSRPLSETYL